MNESCPSFWPSTFRLRKASPARRSSKGVAWCLSRRNQPAAKFSEDRSPDPPGKSLCRPSSGNFCLKGKIMSSKEETTFSPFSKVNDQVHLLNTLNGNTQRIIMLVRCGRETSPAPPHLAQGCLFNPHSTLFHRTYHLMIPSKFNS